MSVPWQVIKDRLVADGAMTEQNVTRTPKARHCKHCRRAVIAAITNIGFEISVEPTPTTPAGELRTLINGGRTFALLPGGPMIWRDRYRITHRDANNEPTHAMHECDKEPPEINHSVRAKKSRTEWQEGDTIPF